MDFLKMMIKHNAQIIVVLMVIQIVAWGVAISLWQVITDRNIVDAVWEKLQKWLKR